MGVNRLFDYIEKESKEWKEFKKLPDNSDKMKGIREKIRTSRPLGANASIERLEGHANVKFVIELGEEGEEGEERAA